MHSQGHRNVHGDGWDVCRCPGQPMYDGGKSLPSNMVALIQWREWSPPVKRRAGRRIARPRLDTGAPSAFSSSTPGPRPCEHQPPSVLSAGPLMQGCSLLNLARIPQYLNHPSGNGGASHVRNQGPSWLRDRESKYRAALRSSKVDEADGNHVDASRALNDDLMWPFNLLNRMSGTSDECLPDHGMADWLDAPVRAQAASASQKSSGQWVCCLLDWALPSLVGLADPLQHPSVAATLGDLLLSAL